MIIKRVANLMRDHRRQASQRRQPLALGGLALKTRDRIGQRVEGGGQQLGVFVLPAAAVRIEILRVRSPVADISRMTSLMVASGPRDGARHGVTEDRGQRGRPRGRWRPGPCRIAFRKRSRSVRERRMQHRRGRVSRGGVAPLGASGRVSATYSLSPSVTSGRRSALSSDSRGCGDRAAWTP